MKTLPTTFINVTPSLFSTKKTPGNCSGVVLQAVFGLIAFLSIFSNLFFCVVLLRKRCLLKKAYNILLIVLAMTDMVTGAVIVVTPGFIVPVDKFPYPTGMTGLSLFCHLIDTKFLIFTMGKASVLMVMCLAIERWLASVKPLQYRIQFSSRRLACYITTIWISNCVLQLYRLSRRIPSEDGCRWAEETLMPITLKAMTISYVFVTFVIPSFVTWVTLLHIWISVRKSPAMNTASGIQTKTRLLHMCVLTALFLTLCWLPDQLNYILSIFKVTSLSSPISDYLLVLALSNSCINPWIYCLANEEFRKEFRKLFSFRICCSAKIPFKSSSYCLRSKDIVKDLEMVLDNTV